MTGTEETDARRRRRASSWGWLFLGAALCLYPGMRGIEAQQESRFRVIVHQANPLSSASRATISRVFLKKQTRWEDGSAIYPVDLSPRSPARQAFTSSIHRRAVSGVTSYWQRMIFAGRDIPPITLTSEEEVVAYVQATPGAIGYVSTGVSLQGVKPLRVTDGAEEAE